MTVDAPAMALMVNEAIVPIRTGLTNVATGVGGLPGTSGTFDTPSNFEAEAEDLVGVKIIGKSKVEVEVELEGGGEAEVDVDVDVGVAEEVGDEVELVEVVILGCSGRAAAIVLAVVCVTAAVDSISVIKRPETDGTAPGGSKIPISLLK